MLTTSNPPIAEVGLDLVRERERAWHRLPHWDPRLWQQTDDGLQCTRPRNARDLSTLGVEWAKCLLRRSQNRTTPKLDKTRPSHGRPQRSEDGRKGGGKARAGSAHSARRQAPTRAIVQGLARADLPSTRARAEQAGGGQQDGRQLQTFDVDGTVTLQSRYHALSTDLFDAADLQPGPHQNTPATTRKDGHGREISTTERLHSGSNIAERHTRTRYLTTGEPEAITRVRWVNYAIG